MEEQKNDFNFESNSTGINSKNADLKASLTYLFIGAFLIAINVVMITTMQKYFPKILAIGMVIFCFGLGTIVLPGKESNVSGNKEGLLKEHFPKETILTKTIWILYIVAGIAGAIVVIVGKTWTSSILFLSGLLLVSGLIMFIRFLVHIFKKSNEDDEKTEEVKHSYYNPSKRGCVLGMLLGLAITGSGVYGFYWTGALDYVVDEISYRIESNKNIKEYGNLISENMDTRVPLRFVEDYGIAPFIKITSLEGEYEIEQVTDSSGMLSITVGELVKEILSEDSEMIEIILADQDYNFIYFSKDELNRIPGVKTQAEQINANNALKFSKNNDYSNFIEENSDKPVIFAMPNMYYQYIQVWDIDTFISLYSKLNPDNPIETVVGLLYLMDNNGNIPGTDFYIAFLNELDGFVWDETTGEIGFVVNYIDNESAGYINTYLWEEEDGLEVEEEDNL